MRAPAAIVACLWAFLGAHPAQADEPTHPRAVVATPRPDVARFAGARVIKLGEVTERVLERNLTIARARVHAGITGAEASVAWALLSPSVGLSGGLGRVDGFVQGSFGDIKEVGFGTVGPFVRLWWQVNVLASLYGDSSASREAHASSENLAETSASELAAAVDAYLDVLRGQAAHAVRLDALHAAEGLRAIASALEKGGTGQAVDVLRSETQVARQRMALLAAGLELETASHLLAYRLHLPVSMLLIAGESELRTEDWVADFRAPGLDLIARAQGNRPEVEARNDAAAAAHHRSAQAIASLAAPSLSAFAQISGVGTAYDEVAGSQRSFGVGLSWDLSPARFLNTRVASERAHDADLAAEVAVDRVAREVADAEAAVDGAHAALAPATEAVDRATEAVTLTEVRFRSGTGSATETIEAQKDLDAARLALVEAVVAMNKAQLRLLASTGDLTPNVLLGSSGR